MEKNTKRKIGIIALLVALVICLYFVASTYAKYTSSTTANTSLGIARWAVTVNGTDATQNDTFTLTLTTDDTDNVAEGKIAPTKTASASFLIDPTNSEVSIDYTVEAEDVLYSGSSVPNDLNVSITSITVENCNVAGTQAYTSSNGSTTGTFASGSTSGFIALADIGNMAVKVTITVTWESTSPDDDSTDTGYGIEAGTLTLPVTVTASQHV